MPLLEARHAVYASTLPGHRGAAPLSSDRRPGVRGVTDAVERLLDDAGIERAHLVGNSLGGWVALELAERGRAQSVVEVIAPSGC
ncbi:Alpha/beta hydrolase family protein [Haloechinothrix alba]|uniref:Alpha/beta hydrolase family protein n=1 Tax=Haloechinothrix alba TaxID=664784 RepID=A0A239AKV8_9PSEU|nr:Alpha/beta hydrolase family protein [Haloechinothrix alba]